MGCSGSKRIPQPKAAPKVETPPPQEESIREPTPIATPEDQSETELIAGDYERVEDAAYDVDPAIDGSTQAGVGTFGAGERFGSDDNGVPGAKYNLPEVTGTDTCNACFGNMTGERFPDMANGIPGAGAYDLPEVTGTDTGGAAFGNQTGERFEEIDNGVPGAGAYDLPEVTGTDTCTAAFGNTTGERFQEYDNGVPGPKYDAPKRYPDVFTEPCTAVFGADKSGRSQLPADETEKAFGRYQVLQAFNKVARKKNMTNTCGFSRTTSKRFTKRKSLVNRMYDTRKSWSTKGGGFGGSNSNRFGPKRGF